MAWQPNPESLNQLAACLKDSLSGFDKTAQKQAELVSYPTQDLSPFVRNACALEIVTDRCHRASRCFNKRKPRLISTTI